MKRIGSRPWCAITWQWSLIDVSYRSSNDCRNARNINWQKNQQWATTFSHYRMAILIKIYMNSYGFVEPSIDSVTRTRRFMAPKKTFINALFSWSFKILQNIIWRNLNMESSIQVFGYANCVTNLSRNDESQLKTFDFFLYS